MDVTLCAGDRVGSGCRSKFPYKEDAGLCCWCLTLSEYDPQSEEWKRIKSLPRCLECGAFGENIEDECCGSCRKKNKELRQEESAEHHNPVTHNRAQVFLSQMNAGKQRQSQVAVGHHQPIRNVSTTPSIPLTNKSLHAMRSQGRSASASRQFTVCVTPMVNGKISTFLGGISSSYSSNSMMGDILQATLDNFNLTWVTRMPANLTRDDVLLRWHGNRRFEEGEHGSVGELYDHHRQAVHSASYLDKLPPQWKTIRSGSSGIPLCFEVHIDTFKWESRTGCVVDGAFGPEPKRKRGAHSQLTSGKSSKRGRLIEAPPPPPARTIPMPVSTFIGNQTGRRTGFNKRVSSVNRSATEGSTTAVKLQIAKISLDAKTGIVGITWPDDSISDVEGAVIANAPFQQGRTKKAYSVALRDKSWVAKRFFNIGHGPNEVTIDENSTELACEVERLYQMSWFLEAFYDRADETGAEVSQDFSVTDCLLAREIISAAGEPSPASGLDFALDGITRAEVTTHEKSVVWMLEPRRSSVVDKWSGTNVHNAHTDKRGMTIDAFTHFAYAYSMKSLVFVDVQSTYGSLPNGRGSSNILFDTMAHSSAQISGVGDQGKDGIACWARQHVCQRMCLSLQLPTMRELEEQSSDHEGDVEGDEDESAPGEE